MLKSFDTVVWVPGRAVDTTVTFTEGLEIFEEVPLVNSGHCQKWWLNGHSVKH